MRYWLCTMLVLAGCLGPDSDTDDSSVAEPSIDLEGDWIWTLTDHRKLGVAFERTHYRLLLAGRSPQRYTLRGDTLRLEYVSIYDSTWKRMWADLEWQAAMRGSDSIVLTPLWIHGGDYNRDGITALEPSYLTRITPRNTWMPKAIDYIAGPCLGSCPIMRTTIDSAGEVRFDAGDHNWLRGSFTGTLDKRAMSELVRRVRSVPESSFGQFYDSDWTDDRTACIRITLNDRDLCACSYGADEPIELRMLMDAVEKVYHSAALNLVDTVASDERLWAKCGDFCGQLDMFIR